jgi:hypothetical protein
LEAKQTFYFLGCQCFVSLAEFPATCVPTHQTDEVVSAQRFRRRNADGGGRDDHAPLKVANFPVGSRVLRLVPRRAGHNRAAQIAYRLQSSSGFLGLIFGCLEGYDPPHET